MKIRKILVCVLAVAMLLCACAKPDGTPTGDSEPVSEPPESKADPSDLFSDRDLAGSYQADEATVIVFDGSAVQITGTGAQQSENTVVISEEGTYLLRGTWADGTVQVAADEKAKVQLVLDSVDIHSSTSAAIYVSSADKVFLTLPQGSASTLSGGESFTATEESNIDAVIFSKDDLTLNGTGALTVESPAGHGIVSKDDLTITGGTYQISAASHGLTGKKCICITGAEMDVESGKDGLHASHDENKEKGFVYIQSGTFRLTCDGDGISASAYVQIDGGDFEITCGGGYENGRDHTSNDWGGMGGMGGMGGHGGMGGNPGGGMGGNPGGRPRTTDSTTASSSTKGVKAGGELLIQGGTFRMNTADDAFHSAGCMRISGGEFTVSSGDDGFHSDENLYVTDGTIVIENSYEGLEGICVCISGGNTSITATDDGINAAGGTDSQNTVGPGGRPGGFQTGSSNNQIIISGGTVYIHAGGDGVDSNGSLTMSGGNVTIYGPTVGDTSVLDFETTGVITGGTFVGTGASMMAVSFTQSENQGVVYVNLGRNISAGTQLTLTDGDGNVIVSATPVDSYAIVILSNAQIVKGQKYTLKIDSLTKTVTAS